MSQGPPETVVVPVKGIAAGKSRLAGILDAAARRDLNRRLLVRTLNVVKAAECRSVIVVSPDEEALAVAAAHGAAPLRQRGDGLNPALVHAAHRAPPGRLIVLPADLPLVAPDDIAALRLADVVAIAPDRRATGTNALALPRPGAIAFRFGPSSFARHLAGARATGIAVEVVRRPGLACDVDTPEDFEAFGRAISHFC